MPETVAANDAFRSAALQLTSDATLIAGGAGDFYMEVMDASDGSVWMCDQTVTREDFTALEIAQPWVKTGIGMAVMDNAAFKHSPGQGEGSAMREVRHGKWRFVHVATPGDRIDPENLGEPLRMTVDKHHILGFAAGREIAILETAEGQFVEVIGSADWDKDLMFPADSKLIKIKLEKPWVVDLPAPTTAYFWMGDNWRSFQGPVTLPQ